jgi:ABC-type glycerol-3-phosphate transport system substrate-binding protein
MKLTNLQRLGMMAALILTVGCSTVPSKSESTAVTTTRTWDNSPQPTPAEKYPVADFITRLLAGLAK